MLLFFVTVNQRPADLALLHGSRSGDSLAKASLSYPAFAAYQYARFTTDQNAIPAANLEWPVASRVAPSNSSLSLPETNNLIR